ncbi:hypothetical protein AB1Y20_013167 [Prymnesium parvum]|uniref:PH domain-containing protein n=1 Tax=Prymnesium parvum TaxID=97485 RepID=A0AB34IMD9_PRYPA
MLSRARGGATPGTGKSVGVPLPSFFGDSFRESDPSTSENADDGSEPKLESEGVASIDLSRTGPLAPQVLKQGFLHKAGRHGQLIWRGRWFVLESDVLCYYTSEKEVGEGKKPKPKGVISLHGSFVQKGKDPLSFKLLTPKRTYAFRADSNLEAQAEAEGSSQTSGARGFRAMGATNRFNASASEPPRPELCGGDEGKAMPGELREFVPVGEGFAVGAVSRSPSSSTTKSVTLATAAKMMGPTKGKDGSGGLTKIRTAESERSGSQISTRL